MKRFATDNFQDPEWHYDNEDSFYKSTEVDGVPFLVNMLDFCSNTELYALKQQVLRRSGAVVFVCNFWTSSSENSTSELEILKENIKTAIECKGSNNFACMVAITKIDLIKKEDESCLEQVESDIKKVIEDNKLTNCGIISTSAKSGEKVTELFHLIIRRYCAWSVTTKQLTENGSVTKLLQSSLSGHSSDKKCNLM